MGKAFGPARQMRKAYGEAPVNYCDYCCNCQITQEHSKSRCCIAYDSTTVWSVNERACGLYNMAFHGIRPRLKPLMEMRSGTGKVRNKEAVEQVSLFDL